MFFDLLITGLSIGAIYGLIAFSISIIYAGLNLVHFAQGEIFAMGAFFALMFYRTFHLPYILSFILGILCTVVFAVVIERTIYKPVLNIKSNNFAVKGLIFTVAGFGVSVSLQNLYWIIWGPGAMPFTVNFGDKISVASLTLQPIYLVILIVTIVLMCLLYLMFKKSKVGLAMKATSYNKDIASLMGINVNRTMSMCFGLGAALSAVAGVLMAPITFVQYNMGQTLFLKGFCAAVLGGLGDVFGSMLGGIILGIVESFGASFIASQYKDIISFVILILVLMFRPGGIFVTKTKQKA